MKKATIFYCDNRNKEAVERARGEGYIVRALDKFVGEIEPFNIVKVIICGKDEFGCKQTYEAKGIKVELEKGSKSEKVDIPEPPKKEDDAVQPAGASDETPTTEKDELIEQGAKLGLKLKKTMNESTMVKLIQEAEDKAAEKTEEE